jgi:DNA-binding transcriptional regulator YiaG
VDGELVEVAEEADLVRRMFRLYLECRTYRGVVTQLNEDGLRTRRGNRWYPNVVKGILINPVYTGANVYGRHASGDTRLKPKEEWTVVPGMREPMVNPEVFDAVQKQIEGAADRRKRPERTRPYLLSGLVRCGKCGSPMYGKTNRSRGKVHEYYTCNANTHLGKEVCEGTSVPADRLQEMIIAKVPDAFAGTEQSLPVQAAEKEEDAAAAEERTRLQNALERVKYRITRVFELYEMGDLTKTAFKERMEKLSAEREGAQEALGALRVQPADPIRSDASEVTCGSLDDASGREFLRAVVREIVVQGTTVELVLADLGDQGDIRFTVSVLPDLDTTTLGGRLKKARLEAGLHQQDVAGLLGVHVKCISNWENGRARPRWLSIEEIESASHAARPASPT